MVKKDGVGKTLKHHVTLIRQNSVVMYTIDDQMDYNIHINVGCFLIHPEATSHGKRLKMRW